MSAAWCSKRGIIKIELVGGKADPAVSKIYIQTLDKTLVSVQSLYINFGHGRVPKMFESTNDTMERVYARIAEKAPNGVWSRADFLDIAPPTAVEKTLQRLTIANRIRRPHRGLYDKPGTSTLTGEMLFPPRSSFVDAIARRDKLRIVVDGMTAANDLGLTTAVPARSTIFADTYQRTIAIHANAGDSAAREPVIYILDFKRIAAKTAFWAGRPGMRIVQALDWYRHDADDNAEAIVNGIVHALQRASDPSMIVDDLAENISATPAWMHPLIHQIASQISVRPDSAEDEDFTQGFRP